MDFIKNQSKKFNNLVSKYFNFSFNNLKFAHGADYHPEYYKILMKSFGRVKDQGLLLKQIQESKEKGLIWDVEQGVNS